MNLEISKLFYNIVPGGVYLAYWVYIYLRTNNKIFESSELMSVYIVLFIISSYFLGYLLQALFKIIRNLIDLDEIIILIVNRNDNISVKREIFHKRNAILWKKGQHELSNYFASYAAFWSNVFIGSSATTFILLANPTFCVNKLNVHLLIQILLIIVSCIAYYLYKKSQVCSVYNQS